MEAPKLSAVRYPWSAVPALSRHDAAAESALARFAAVTVSPSWSRLRAVLALGADAVIAMRIVPTLKPYEPAGGGDATVLARPSEARIHGNVASGATAASFDPHAASCEVRREGVAIEVVGASAGIFALAQRMVGGLPELAAARPLGVVEQSLFALVIATMLEDLGIAGHVWPRLAPSPPVNAATTIAIACDLRIGELALLVEVRAPRAVLLRLAPRAGIAPGVSSTVASSVSSGTGPAAWLDRVTFDVPIVAGRCAIHHEDLPRLAVRSLVTLERPATGTRFELDLGLLGGRPGGAIGIGPSGRAGALAAEVLTGYVPREMSLPDDAHVELTVALGATQLSLRQLTELAVGQIVQLGRPLAGPFELRAAGRVLGRGELVDVDGELAVRIVSLGD